MPETRRAIREDRLRTARASNRACGRCRFNHKKCDINVRKDVCTNCETARVPCKNTSNSELKIRFSSFTNPRSARKASNRKCHRQPRDTISNSFASISNNVRPILGNQGSQYNNHDDALPNYFQSRSSSGAIISGNTQSRAQHSQKDSYPDLSLRAKARLIKHFQSVLIPWFDYCVPGAPFRSYMQGNLQDNQGLFYAILAVSARYLEATTSSHYYGSNEYEHYCLQHLIPTMGKDESMFLQGDAILFSALLLRLLDEMTDPTETNPITRHAVSAPLLTQISQQNLESSEFQQAAMAIVLRQEIHVANVTKRAVELSGKDCGIDESLDEASDFVWVWRIMSHTARVTNYAYGEQSKSQGLWDVLWLYLEDWRRQTPSSFRPLYDSDEKGHSRDPSTPSKETAGSSPPQNNFPELYYAYDCPISGQQYLEICTIILLAHDPRATCLGAGWAAYKTAQEKKIRRSVRRVCGIWLSNPEYPPARVLAGLAIGLAGELFTEPAETQQLLDIIAEAESHVGWPCLKVSPRLREFWGFAVENGAEERDHES